MVVVLLALGGYVVWDQHRRGVVQAADLCDSFEDRGVAARVLNEALPDEKSYVTKAAAFSSHEGEPSVRIDCLVDSGAGDRLLNIGVRSDSPDWALAFDRQGYTEEEYGKLRHRNLGNQAVSNRLVAAVHIPCSLGTKKGRPFDAYGLVAFAYVWSGKLRGSDAEAERALLDLALNVGRPAYAHQRCTLPSKLP